LVNLKSKNTGDGDPKKAIEKTVLRFLGSRTFTHGLGGLPTFAAEFSDGKVAPIPAIRQSADSITFGPL
jgi:hypothetical protein